MQWDHTIKSDGGSVYIDPIYRTHGNFRWMKFGQAFILHIYNGRKTFRQSGKGHHIIYAIIIPNKEISVIKFLPMAAGGEINKNFLLAKISM